MPLDSLFILKGKTLSSFLQKMKSTYGGCTFHKLASFHAIVSLLGKNLKNNDVLQAICCSLLADVFRNDLRSPLDLEWK